MLKEKIEFEVQKIMRKKKKRVINLLEERVILELILSKKHQRLIEELKKHMDFLQAAHIINF